MKLNNEIKVGLMVMICLLILAFLTIKVGTFNLKKEGYSVSVIFKNVKGIETNSPVMFNGFEVGLVDSVKINDNGDKTEMELGIWLKKDARLREGVIVTIKNLGFMGEKYIDFSSGEKSGDFLKPGAVIIGKEPPDFENLLEKGEEIAGHINNITVNIEERLEVNKKQIDDIVTNLNSSLGNISSISGNIDERLKVNSNRIDEIVANLNKVTVNLEELSLDLKANPWKLLHREKTRK
ncbi:MAG: MCE family protein [Candidatus Omnitrophica bacterium]|nr:MCE family protein [Candidatus Omnitrophota bacterium]